ncbi:hypothetical protein BC828DRAFT_400935 [Blastocladiella britannica]|nr:hypothetical protein BC828DRAFT_400935 [Blastocladiella britannica]
MVAYLATLLPTSPPPSPHHHHRLLLPLLPASSILDVARVRNAFVDTLADVGRLPFPQITGRLAHLLAACLRVKVYLPHVERLQRHDATHGRPEDRTALPAKNTNFVGNRTKSKPPNVERGRCRDCGEVYSVHDAARCAGRAQARERAADMLRGGDPSRVPGMCR